MLSKRIKSDLRVARDETLDTLCKVIINCNKNLNAEHYIATRVHQTWINASATNVVVNFISFCLNLSSGLESKT